jgi:hypothetical protein
MPTQYQKEDDYTLLVTNKLPGGGEITRLFNFAAQQVTTIFHEKAEMSAEKSAYASTGGVSVARAVALTSQMQVQKFSDFESQAELELMRQELIKRSGKPPELGETLGKTKPSITKLG